MRVCYFIQAHKNPEQVYRLVRTIKKSSSNSLIVIGYDFTNSSIDMEPVQDLSDVYLLKSNFVIKRGELSILKPYLNAISWLLNEKFEFDWLAYLSGQDYPIKPIAEIENFLFNTEYDGFIEYFNVLSEESPWSILGIKRYFYQYYNLPKFAERLYKNKRFWGRIPRKLERLFRLNFYPTMSNDFKVGLVPFISPFSEEFKCYGGNHRHFLSRKCVLFLHEFINSHYSLMMYYEKTVLPEESLIQTILVNCHQFSLYNQHKIYDDYTDSYKDGHPKTLGTEDYSKIIKSKSFFARKFEPNSTVLDMLDTHIFTLNHNKVNL